MRFSKSFAPDEKFFARLIKAIVRVLVLSFYARVTHEWARCFAMSRRASLAVSAGSIREGQRIIGRTSNRRP